MTNQTASTGTVPMLASRCGMVELSEIASPAWSTYSSKPMRTCSVPLST